MKGTYMKIFLKKRHILFLGIICLMLTFAMPEQAQASPVVLSFSTNDVSVGDSFSVTVAGASSSNLSLHYDGTMVTLKSQGRATLDGNTLSISGRSATFTFEAKQQGNAGFVASSNMYPRSSAVIGIKEAVSKDTDEKVSNDTEQTENEGKEDKKEDAVVKETSSEKDTENNSKKAKAEADHSGSSVEKHDISSSDLSFKQLILDRRMLILTGLLLAIIIVLIIRLTLLHFAVYGDYEGDDIDFDDEETKRSDTDQIASAEKTDQKKFSGDLDLGEIDEEKLTMPKAPKRPNKKLELSDLNKL